MNYYQDLKETHITCRTPSCLTMRVCVALPPRTLASRSTFHSKSIRSVAISNRVVGMLGICLIAKPSESISSNAKSEQIFSQCLQRDDHQESGCFPIKACLHMVTKCSDSKTWKHHCGLLDFIGAEMCSLRILFHCG